MTPWSFLAAETAPSDAPTLLSLLAGLLAVIVFARIAAEIAERLGQPTVLAEIAAGVLIGPSVLGMVQGNDVLHLLAEVGAILLLFEVGLHMDLDDLRSVGGDAFRVAILGVVAPAAAVFPIAIAMGVDRDPAIFLAAAVTATSVGITARVFAEMRVLSTPEARTVLGAAVVDDVLGLLILTFVTQTLGQFVHSGSLGMTIATALGFVIFGSIFAIAIAPRLFEFVARRSRANGTLAVATFTFALGISTLSAWAGLAPLVGAFIAGVAAARSDRSAEFQRKIAPVGHIIIPIFFVSVGLEIDITVFGDVSAILLALAVSAAAIVTKIIGSAGMARGKGDRLLVGIGMVPRGEVGLIFATLGIASGVLDARTHAALVLVVLITTVVTPPALRWRLKHRPQPGSQPGESRSDGEYLTSNGREVDLVASPPADDALRVVLQAALAAAERRPSKKLSAWLRDSPIEQLTWDDESRAALVELLRGGRYRSFRLLESTGTFATLFPTIAAEPRHATDPYGLEGSGEATWDELLDLEALLRDPADPASDAFEDFSNPETVLLAALARGAFLGDQAAANARTWVSEMGFPWGQAEEVGELVAERRLLPASALSPDLGKEDQTLELAAHLGSDRIATALWILAAADARQDGDTRARLDELHRLLHAALTQPALRGPEGVDLLEARRQAVAASITDIPSDIVAEHLREAPRRYLLTADPDTIAIHLHLIDPMPGEDDVRLTLEQAGMNTVRVHVVVRDRRGVLAALATQLAEDGYEILDASASVWDTRIAILVFVLLAPDAMDASSLEDNFRSALRAPAPSSIEPVDGHISVDNHSSPWHSMIEVRAPNRAGLLGKVAAAISSIGGHISSATITTSEGNAIDRFAVVGANGEKLGPKDERALRSALKGKSPPKLRR